MKTIQKLLTTALLGLLTLTAGADKNVEAGPKGGRLLVMDAMRAEFLVEKDKFISLTFYDTKLKPLPIETQTASATAETKRGKVRLDFEMKGGILVSKTALPEGDGYNLVVQVRATAEAKPKNFRILLELHTCDGCKRAEYACTCAE